MKPKIFSCLWPVTARPWHRARVSSYCCMLIVACTVSPTVLGNPCPVLTLSAFQINYPPYLMYDGNKPYGPDVDIIDEAFEQMGCVSYKLETRSDAWQRIYQDLEEGIVDLTAGFPSDDYDRIALYSKWPLHVSRYRVISTRDAALIHDPADLKYKNLGLVRGNSLNHIAKDHFGSRVNYMILPSFEVQIRLLKHGRTDAIFTNTDIFNYYRNQWGWTDKILIHPLEITKERPFHLLISKSSKKIDAQEFIDQFDDAMTDMHRDGAIQRILTGYYGRSRSQ